MCEGIDRRRTAKQSEAMAAQHSKGLAQHSEGNAWIDTLSEGIAPLRKGEVKRSRAVRKHGEDRPDKGIDMPSKATALDRPDRLCKGKE